MKTGANRGSSSVEVFVVAHTDSTLVTVPVARGITPVDLRALSLDQGYDNRFAESRFLMAPEARASGAELIGICSANYDLKWPDGPRLIDLPRLARHLRRDQALGVELATADEWMASAEHHHPGMSVVLDRVRRTFGLELHDHRVPGCNTFICHRDQYLSLLDTFGAMLDAVLGWYGPEIPFRYRCPDCGTESDAGRGRWTNARHVGYFGERLTRLIFSSRPDLIFSTPAEFVGSSPTRSFEARVRDRLRRWPVGRAGRASVATPWHLSARGLDTEAASEFSACPVCSVMAHQH